MNGKAKHYIYKYGPTVLSVLAGAGVIGTGYLAAKGAKEESEKGPQSYIPAVACGTATIACIAGSRYIGYRNEAALISASLVAAKAYQNLKESADFSEDPVQHTSTDVMYTLKQQGRVEDTGYGNIIFIEDFTGRRFKCSMEVVKDAIKKLNDDFKIRGFVSLNDFYKYLNLPPTCAGQVLGWSIDNDSELYYVDFEHAILDLNIFIDHYESLGNVIKYPITPVIGLGIGQD